MNRIVKAFIISLVLSSVLVTLFRVMATGRYARNGAISYLNRRSPRFTANGTLFLSPGPAGPQATVDVLRKRIAASCRRFTLETKDNNLWTLEAEDINDTLLFRQMLTVNSNLQFYELYSISEIYPFLVSADSIIGLKLAAAKDSVNRQSHPSPDSVISQLLSKKTREGALAYDSHHPLLNALRLSDHSAIVQSGLSAQIGYIPADDTAILNGYLQDPRIAARLPYDVEFRYGLPYAAETDNPPLPFYALRKEGENPLLDESFVSDTHMGYNSLGEESIAIRFNQTGKERFARMTTQNTGKCIAMVTNGKVATAVKVDGTITSGVCNISGNGEQQQYRVLSIALKYGPLADPVTVKNMSFSLSGFFSYPWAKYLLVGVIAFIVFFALVLFIDRAIQNAKKPSPAGTNP